MFNDFYSGKKVFITGHTGFKGAWLSLWLEKLGAQVHGYSLEPPSEPNLHDLAKISAGIKSTHGDIRDLASLEQAMKSFKPDVVIHMAAQSLVRLSYAEPAETIATNVVGTVKIGRAHV